MDNINEFLNKSKYTPIHKEVKSKNETVSHEEKSRNISLKEFCIKTGKFLKETPLDEVEDEFIQDFASKMLKIKNTLANSEECLDYKYVNEISKIYYIASALKKKIDVVDNFNIELEIQQMDFLDKIKGMLLSLSQKLSNYTMICVSEYFLSSVI